MKLVINGFVTNPRVYHFLLDHRVGGPHVYTDTIRKFLSGIVDSTIITTGRGPMTDYSLVNLRHIWSPFYVIELAVNFAIVATWVVSGKLKRKGTLFAVHGGVNLAPLMAARLLGIPVVWYFHETTPRFRIVVRFGKWLLRNSKHKLVVVARKSSEVYELDNPVFLPGSVDPRFWSRDLVRSSDLFSCGWANCNAGHPLRLLAVGNLNPLKGVDILLNALEGVNVPWHLQLVGAALETHQQFTTDLHHRVSEISKNNADVRVDFLGWQSKENVRALLASCDIFVLPSRSEACPIALLEAIAMGCRCVAADVGDVSCILADDPNSKIFAASSIAECRNAITSLREQSSNSHSGTVINATTWQLSKVAARTDALYRKMLEPY